MKPVIRVGSIVAGLMVIWPAVSAGSMIISLNNVGSTSSHEIEVAPGTMFNIDMNVNIDEDEHYGIRFNILASQANVFDIEQVTAYDPNIVVSNSIVGGIDPKSDYLRMRLTYPLYFDLGLSTVAMLSLEVDPSAQRGTYTLDVVDGWFSWVWLVGDLTRATPGPSFIVQVVPEPGSLSLFLVFSLIFRRHWS